MVSDYISGQGKERWAGCYQVSGFGKARSSGREHKQWGSGEEAVENEVHFIHGITVKVPVQHSRKFSSRELEAHLDRIIKLGMPGWLSH